MKKSQHDNRKILYEFPVDYLWEGLVLEEDLYDRTGEALLIPAGEEITWKRLEHIISFGGKERYVMSGDKVYKKVMESRVVNPEDDQELLERNSGYTRLRNQVDRLLAHAHESQKVSMEMAGDVARNVVRTIHEQNMTVLLNCIDTPRPMDEQLQRHSLNVGLLNGIVAESLGMEPKDVYELIIAGTLHDVGKTMIPDAILNAPRRLTKEEFEIMKRHAVYSYELLGDDVNDTIKEAVLYHHERSDGSGYPDALMDDIPLFARITAVTDVYDALVDERVYKSARVPFDVLAGLREGINQGLDEKILTVFIHYMSRYLRGRKVRMTDGSVGEVFFVPPNDLAHPIVKVGEDIRQTDDYWQCQKVIS
ncbi:MAG: HD-GYP domain-containing protein [Lachnospiraceae bacterium]|jgi:HD-GYP domain-containing protein (c-di-GMP phosphodiesterase class II)|nr:HD-GYP domain-containing protein [Lachnospiraceae bacterium]